MKQLNTWDVAWFAVEEKNNGRMVLYVDFCCHFRLEDGKYFSARCTVKGTKEEQQQYIKRFARKVKQQWRNIVNKTVLSAIQTINGE